ncbi:unnamed protein product [Periconia digitata]|uniref:Azaphilone pigments biosynthesis cluster protein L N-terminal domain-containing protein n=1 Tax=Periconia digitata TaxID=1303443 RepID=A0A9W4UP49_9PLEO|nr:unnamed protein product [Periconia digitata]
MSRVAKLGTGFLYESKQHTKLSHRTRYCQNYTFSHNLLASNMAAELGIISAVITLADATYKSCKALHDLIEGIRDAPDELSYLRTDINEVGRTLQSFADLNQQIGAHESAQYRVALEHSLVQLRPCIQELQSACNAFSAKLDRIFKHSTASRMSNRDLFRFQIKESEVKRFASRLSTFKTTATVALGLASLAATSSTAQDVSKLRQLIESSSNSLLLQVSDVKQELGRMVAFVNSKQSDEGVAVSAARQAELDFWILQKQQLEDCLKVCTSAARGVEVKHAEVTDEAKQLIGNIGKVDVDAYAVEVETAVAKVRSRQVIGNIDGASALEFLR